jgi:hypothetical protein
MRVINPKAVTLDNGLVVGREETCSLRCFHGEEDGSTRTCPFFDVEPHPKTKGQIIVCRRPSEDKDDVL